MTTSNDKETNEYRVGRGRPPRERNFKTGQSGNPSGRPKGSKNKTSMNMINAIILAEAYRTVNVNEGGKQHRMTMLEAVVRAIAVNAGKGQLRAQQLFLDFVTSAERNSHLEKVALAEAAISYKLEASRVLERYRQNGLEFPEFCCVRMRSLSI